jgi:hypothetical protein
MMCLFVYVYAYNLSENIHGGNWYTATLASPVGLGPTFGKHERTSEFLV